MSTPIDDALRCASLFIGYAVDHAPDGWPAIRQRQLTEAGEHIRRLVAENEALRAQMALCEGTLESRDRNIEALTNGRHELQAQGKHPAPCAKFCEATAFGIEARELKRQIAEQAALIRKQGRELGEQDALLQQALDALDATGPTWVVKERAAKAAIRQHREKKGEAG